MAHLPKVVAMFKNLIENIKQAVRDIFRENGNKPLEMEELILLVDKKLRNGEIDTELTAISIDIMLDRFELTRLPDNKLKLT